MTDNYSLIDQLREKCTLSINGLKHLLEETDQDVLEYLFWNARQVREKHYGKRIYMRGLIEFTNYCRNNCYYCGIRKGNKKLERYRLNADEIYTCAKEGYRLGFRTFVMQGGEDRYFTREKMGEIIRNIKETYPDCAVTLSFGEWENEDYAYWFSCGAERYLLRHETANERHYHMLHPSEMQLSHRKACLVELKKIGYQVGAGFMVGSPGQTVDTLIEDIHFLQDFQPHMVGIGPFISQKDTPFAEKENGSLLLTLKLLAMIRLILPKVLLPSTTALGTIHEKGREMGILAGANVIMPNLSPMETRKKYLLYDNKNFAGDESAQCINSLRDHIDSLGYELYVGRGDSLMY